jgi:hypothetical protein
VHERREERRGEDQADRAEDASRRDRRDQNDERVEIQRRSHCERLQDVLKQAVREEDDQEHDQGDGRPLGAERDDNGERACHERPDEGHVGP